MLATGPVASAAVVNLTNGTVAGHSQSTLTSGGISFVGGMINDALFRRPTSAEDSNSGSGVFRDLYRLDNNSGIEQGYNRARVMDSSVPNGFQPDITLGDLVEDATGSAYVFVVDTNEPGNATNKHVSLDDFRIYLGGPSDPVALPEDLAGMESSLGVNVYSMNESGQENHVLMDYSLYSGSGQMDLFIFVPKTLFAGYSMDSLVYIYSRFGGFAEAPGFDAAAGPEQVSIPGKAITSPVDPLVPEVGESPLVPEPGVILLLLGGLLPGVCRRRR